jgi:hypothetical protein
LKVTVLAPLVAPKFVPAIVTEVATTPDVGFRLVIVGAVPPPTVPARNDARAAPQISEVFNVPFADMGAAAVSMRSSTANLVFGAAGTRSWMTYPLPAVNVLAFAVERRPSTRSPLAAGVALDAAGALLVPCAIALTFREFAVATPEYSRMAKRNVPPDGIPDTVTVFAPPAIPSA